MFRRAEAVVAGGRGDTDTQRIARGLLPPTRSRPARALDALLDTGPGFPAALRGYDRLEVDNYVAWIEAELRAARQETDDLMARYGRCAAELELSRRLLAQSPEAQELTHVSERIGEMLRLAADEATALIAAGAAEADRIRAEARLDADARLQKAHEIKQVAVDVSDRMCDEARRLREEAEAEVDRARTEAAALLDRARAEAERMVDIVQQERREAEEAAVRAAAAQVAALQVVVDDLEHQRTHARESLQRLTAQIDDALSALATTPAGNIAVLAAPAEGEVAVLAAAVQGEVAVLPVAPREDVPELVAPAQAEVVVLAEVARG